MNPNLEISTVIGCRMGCDYCPQKIHVKNYKDEIRRMTLDDFKTMISTVPKDVEIVFAGMAEPWLNPDCTAMVIHAFSRGHKIGVYTTGVGMTVGEAIMIRDLPFLHFTLHLPDNAGRMTMKITDEWKQVVGRLLTIRGVQKMVIGRLHPEAEAITGHVPDGSPGLFSRAGNLRHLAIPRRAGTLHCSACGPKIDHNILLPNGDVLLCCMDYAQDHIIGNLFAMNYADIFQSDEYKRVMAGLEDESMDILCRKCEVSSHGKG